MKVAIIGQGVAGTLLAFELEQRKIDFQIIDQGINHSSAIAAGIMNPVVFRRLTKSWMIDECWDLAIKTYKEIEHRLGISFLHAKPMRRMFASEQEVGYWETKSKNPDFQRYIAQYPEDDISPKYAQNTYGNGLVKCVYHIEVATFLGASKDYFHQLGKISTESVDYFKILKKIQDQQFSLVVFCQGYKNFENPFFGNLPVQTTKGQILTVKNDTVNENEILNRKCFMLPIGNELFRVGATYEWEQTALTITESARIQLEENLRSLINVPFEVVAQQAGIRPTSPDRRPILGEHPGYKNLFILNGLGTKGYLLAPWCVQHLCNHIFNQTNLNPEVNLTRFGVL